MRDAKLVPLSLAGVVFLAAATARAQVDVEPLRKELADDVGVGGRLAGSLNGSRGNVDGLVFGSSGLLGGHVAPHFGYVAGSAHYTEYGGTAQVAKAFGHVRYDYEVLSWLAAELFFQLEADRFRRISLRELAGTGPRFTLIHSEPFDLHYGDGYMLEHTVQSDGQDVLAHRFSNYAALAYRPDARVVLTTTTYYQPRFDDFSDFKLLGIAGAELEVTKLLHTRIEVSVRHESRVPAGVKRTDVEVDNALVLKL